MKNLTPIGWLLAFLSVITISLAGLSQIACSAISGQTFTYISSAGASVTINGFGAWCENNLATIRSATASGIIIAANALKANTTFAKVAGYVKQAEVAIQPLLSQGTVTYAKIDTALASIKVNDPSGIYAYVIEPAINLVAGYIVQLQNDGVPGKVIVDVLAALNNGLNDAANELNPPVTTMLKIHTDLRPVHGWTNPYNVQLAKQ